MVDSLPDHGIFSLQCLGPRGRRDNGMSKGCGDCVRKERDKVGTRDGLLECSEKVNEERDR
jgi:hypothetical protein